MDTKSLVLGQSGKRLCGKEIVAGFSSELFLLGESCPAPNDLVPDRETRFDVFR